MSFSFLLYFIARSSCAFVVLWLRFHRTFYTYLCLFYICCEFILHLQKDKKIYVKLAKGRATIYVLIHIKKKNEKKIKVNVHTFGKKCVA